MDEADEELESSKKNAADHLADALLKLADEEMAFKNKMNHHLWKYEVQLRRSLASPQPDCRPVGFWLKAMLNAPALSRIIYPQDHFALSYLTDITVEMTDHLSLMLHFHFKRNPFFEQSCLTKIYSLSFQADRTSPSLPNRTTLLESVGCRILWRRRMNTGAKYNVRQKLSPWTLQTYQMTKRCSFFNYLQRSARANEQYGQILHRDYSIASFIRLDFLPNVDQYFERLVDPARDRFVKLHDDIM